MIGVEDFAGGIFKAAVFGAIVAVAGCLRGMRCGQDAAAVGNAATSAVVTSIVGIVVADAAHQRAVPCPRHPLSRRAWPSRAWPTAMAAACCSTTSTSPWPRARWSASSAAAAAARARSCGCSTGLLPPLEGSVRIDGQELLGSRPGRAGEALIRRFGMMYQGGALWTSMTLAENVGDAARALHRPRPAQRARASPPTSWPWWASPASRTSCRRRSAAAWPSERRSRAPWRSIPSSCSSTSRRPGSTR